MVGILLITMVFDYLTTINFVSKLGVEAEANHVVGWLISNLGLYIGLLNRQTFTIIFSEYVCMFTSKIREFILTYHHST